MKDVTFEKAIEVILKHEGGYSNDPVDLGGETKYGITKRSYPNLDIKNLTIPQAYGIYKKDYWDKFKMIKYPDVIRLQMFDMTVNMGFKNAFKVLQRTLNRFGNVLVVDGLPGPKTFDALDVLQYNGDTDTLPHLIALDRVFHYTTIVAGKPTQVRFLKGWTKRADDVLMRSIRA